MRRLLRIVPAYWLAFVVTDYVMHIDTQVHPGVALAADLSGAAAAVLPLPRPHRAHPGVVVVHGDRPSTCFLPLYAMVVARGRPLGPPAAGSRAGGGGGALRHGPRRALLALAPALAPRLRDARVAAGVPRPVRPGDVPGGAEQLARPSRSPSPRWLWHPAMPWVSWVLAVGVLWAVAHLGVSRAPLEHNPPGRGLALEVLYGLFAFFLLLPAVFGPQQRGAIRWVAALQAGGRARRRLLRDLPVAPGVGRHVHAAGPASCSACPFPTCSAWCWACRWRRPRPATCWSSAPSSR